ncbi:MAG: hypothetical protein QXH95_06285 [Thermoplasmata archaeon]
MDYNEFIKNIYYYEVQFNEPFTLNSFKGDYSDSGKQIYSDTIHAAITQMAFEYNLLEEKGIRDFCDNFVVSNLYVKEKLSEEKSSFFLPFPIVWKSFFLKNNQYKDSRDNSLEKSIKKVEFIELDALNEINNKGKMDLNNYYIDNVKRAIFLKEKAKKLNNNKWLISEEVGRNVQSRVSGGASERIQPFFIERVYVDSNVSFFFIVKVSDKYKKIVDDALHILSKSGIGSDKNVGNGKFKVICDGKNLPDQFKRLFQLKEKDDDLSVNISLFNPELTSSELTMLIKNGFYQFIKRGGWITSSPFHTLRKKNGFMIKEGSCFADLRSIVSGRLLDLSPEWNVEPKPIVFRSGKSIFIRIRNLSK